MSTRYYKATDGKVTVFRATAERQYRSASFITKPDGQIARLSFSSGSGSYETQEITAAEYRALVALKESRCRLQGRTDASSPQCSWISNASL